MEETGIKTTSILLRFNEIALKGLNRKWFQGRLAMNSLRLIDLKKNRLQERPRVELLHNRILLHMSGEIQDENYLEKLFGMSSWSPVSKIPSSVSDILTEARNQVRLWIQKKGLPRSFSVRTRRSDKRFPYNSLEVDRKVGTEIILTFPTLIVNLDEPELTLGIEIHKDFTFLWSQVIKGKGGLPVGTNAPVLSLISGGIDSPVAALQILKRGSPMHFIHFHGAPFVSNEILHKLCKLTTLINSYQPRPQPLISVPFGKIQEQIALVCPPKLRTVLYRRMMFRIASEYAMRKNIRALVTGESLGQVASQTVENLSSIDQASALPVLRPLIGLDKEEIISLARNWGTYPISIKPGTDSCTLFADKHPILRSEIDLLMKHESKLPIQDMQQRALDAASKLTKDQF